jgi:hypothetical protein
MLPELSRERRAMGTPATESPRVRRDGHAAFGTRRRGPGARTV